VKNSKPLSYFPRLVRDPDIFKDDRNNDDVEPTAEKSERLDAFPVTIASNMEH
jgi:hypothetical protein